MLFVRRLHADALPVAVGARRRLFDARRRSRLSELQVLVNDRQYAVGVQLVRIGVFAASVFDDDDGRCRRRPDTDDRCRGAGRRSPPTVNVVAPTQRSIDKRRTRRFAIGPRRVDDDVGRRRRGACGPKPVDVSTGRRRRTDGLRQVGYFDGVDVSQLPAVIRQASFAGRQIGRRPREPDELLPPATDDVFGRTGGSAASM